MRLRRRVVWTGVTALALVAILLIRQLDGNRQYRALLVEGERALEAGEALGAVDAFTSALQIRASSMVGRYRRGEAYADLGRFDEALADLNEARRLAPGAREPLEALGRLADLRGQPSEAAVWYAQAADQLAVADPRLLHALALARYRAGMPAAAIEPLKNALTRDPSMAEGHYLLGLASRDAGLPDEAAVAFEQAVRLAPGMVAARQELADLYLELRRAADEVVVRRALAALDPTSDRYVDLALASMRAGRPADSFAALAQAEATGESNSRLALALGRVHLADAERDNDQAAARRALAALERALGGTARRSEGLAWYGRALYLLGDHAGAERLLKEAVSTSPVDPEAFGFLADAAERLGHHETARDALLNLSALKGDTALPRERAARARRIGAISLAAGDATTAVQYLSVAVKTDAPDAGTLGLFAQARWQSGDLVGARATLDEALALDRLNPELRRLARTIR